MTWTKTMRGLLCLILTIHLSFQSGLADHSLEFEAVRELLDAGFQERRVAITDLEKAYDRSIEQVGEATGRLDYAYSIVLRKNFHGDESAEQLIAAAESDDRVFLAKEELIRQHIKKNRFSDAISGLVDLSKSIGEIPAEHDASKDAFRSARWVGLTIAFLKDGLERDDIKEAATNAEQKILNNLGDRYTQSYQIGRGDMTLRKRSLLAEVAELKAAVQAENAEQIVKAKQEVEDIRKRQDEIAEKLAEIQDVTNDDVADLDSKLKALGEQLEASLEAEQAMQVNMATIRFDIDAITLELARLRDNFDDSLALRRRFFILDQQLRIRQNELFVLSNDYGLLLQSRQNIQQVANQVLARRKQLAGRFRAQSNSANEEYDRLTKLEERFKKIEEKAKDGPEFDRKVRSKLRKVRDFDSYDKRNVDIEREMLLTALEARQ